MQNRISLFQSSKTLYIEKVLKACFWGLAFFLSGGIAIKGMPLPIIIPVSYYLLKEERWQGFVLLFVMLAGCLWGFGASTYFYTYFLVVLSTVALNLLITNEKYKFTIIIAQFILLLSLRLLVFPLAGELFLQFILIFAEMILLGLIFLLLKEFYLEQSFSLPLPFILLTIGLVNSADITGGVLLPACFVLAVGRVSGHTLGMGAGLIIGVLRAITGTGNFYEMGYLPLLGLFVSALPKYSRWIYLVGVLGITIAFSNLMGYSEMITYIVMFLSVMLSALLVLLLPGNIFSIDKGQLLFIDDPQSKEIREVSKNFNYRFHALAGVFDMLADIFKESSAGERGLGEEFIQEFILTASRGVCHNCPKHKECWQDKYMYTQKGFFKVFSLFAQHRSIDLEKLREAFGVSCIDWHRLSLAIRQGLDAYRLHYYWQREFFEQQDLLAQQMSEMGDIILNLAKEMQDTYQTQKEKELYIEKALAEKGYLSKNISLYYHRRNYEIQLEMNPCGGKNHCRTHILSLLRSIMGCPLSLHVKKCGFVTHGSCHLCFSPKNVFKVDVGIAAISSSQENTSGDRFFFNELGNGQFVAVISDGMGTGYSAARESSAVVNLLDKILNAGFSHEIAVRAINTVLNLRNRGEKFATIDMVIFDTYSGRCNMVKVGAAPSLLRHLQEVFILEGDTPPAGVLHQIKTSTHEYYLERGDNLVLLSDGAFEGAEDMPNILQQELLRGNLPANAQEKAEYFLGFIKKRQVNVSDDITILLLQIERI